MRLILLVLIGTLLFPRPAHAPQCRCLPPPVTVQVELPELPSRATVDFAPADVEFIARVIHVEACGESFAGKVAVGAVIMNRVRDPRFPATVREVITEPGQFVVGSGTSPDCIEAAMAALSGEDPSNGALYFYNPAIATDEWIRTREVTARIGRHVFAR